MGVINLPQFVDCILNAFKILYMYIFIKSCLYQKKKTFLLTFERHTFLISIPLMGTLILLCLYEPTRWFWLYTLVTEESLMIATFTAPLNLF